MTTRHFRPVLTLLLLTAAPTFAQTTQTNLSAPATELPTVTVIGQAPPLPQPETIAASVVAGNLFDRGNYDNTRELTAIAPNVSTFDGNNQRTPRFSIRGFRENNFFVGEPVAAFYVDDVPCTDLASRGLPLYDIASAEILRGPQGTLYGANGIGGVMNLRTQQPGKDWYAHATVGFGSYNEQSYQVGLSGPVAKDKLAFGVSGLFASQDGFVENLLLNTRADDRQTLSGRAVLRWTPTERWTIALTLTAEQFRDDFIPTYYPGHDAGQFDVYRNIDGYNDTEAFGQALRIGYDGEGFKLVSITAHRNWEQNLLQDFDFTGSEIRNGFSNPKVETWSQEVRIQSSDSEDKLKWLGGIYFADTRNDSDSGSEELLPVTLAPGLVTQPTTLFHTQAASEGQTYAAFGQTTWSATEKFNLIGGLRLNYDVRSIDRSKTVSSSNATFGGFPIGLFANTYGVYDADTDFTYLLPKVGAAWHFNQDILGYANFAGGYQSGGFNSSVDTTAQSEFAPATSWNYELGLKSDWADHCFSANLALFYTDAHDYQVYRLAATDPTQAYVENADRATMMGAELEFTARPAEGWEFTGGMGYTHAEYNRYFDSVNNVNLDGKTISFVPEFTANVAGQYRFPFGFYVRVELQALGNYELTDDNSAQQPAFGLLNARIGYDAKHWSIYVFGRNMLDQEYAANALDLRYAQQPDQLILQPGNPAIFGVAFTAKF